ncbi:YrhB domain-containing protein [Streptomyces chattanoogensis]
MISREWAVDVVTRHLRDDEETQYSPPMAIIEVRQHPLGWLVVCQSPEFARTRDPRDALVGHGPFLVDGLDGSLHMVHPQFCRDGLDWETQYRRKVRGEIPPRALDIEVRQLTGLGRRFDALKTVRRAGGGLGPADALRYVEAVAGGNEPPADLVARLPQPDLCDAAISTYSGPNPEPPQERPVQGTAP